MKRLRVDWDSLVMFRREWLMLSIRKNEWIQVERTKEGRWRPKITLVVVKKNFKKKNLNWGSNKLYEFGYNIMMRKNICDQLWLICHGFITDPKKLSLRLSSSCCCCIVYIL